MAAAKVQGTVFHKIKFLICVLFEVKDVSHGGILCFYLSGNGNNSLSGSLSLITIITFALNQTRIYEALCIRSRHVIDVLTHNPSGTEA